ncbi:MAG: bifunctional UDP-N-acetylglucosamine diphosphorylase/glucosamine-1-phosphate N-acetyltransferase GlmU [Gammaproteobacteria bacterium]
MPFSVVILAAGEGTRMRSDLPKMLQPLAGRPLLEHVIEAAEAAGPDAVHVVYGFGGDTVREALGDKDVRWVLQERQLGTGDAVAKALPDIPDDHIVVVLCGDVPLISPATIKQLVESATSGQLTVLTTRVGDPVGYGRIVRNDSGSVRRIVEEADADTEIAQICEINTGLMAAPASLLASWLSRVDSDNAQGEFYLTDVVEIAVESGLSVAGEICESEAEVLGVNDRRQLADAEAALRARNAAEVMESGVTLIDPARVDIRGKVTCGRDVIIDVNVVLEGDVTLGDRVHVGPNSVLRNAQLGHDTVVLPNSLIESASAGEGCSIGPYGRLRPGACLADGAKVGNFVEIKNSHIGPGSKVSHLTYIGDAEVGQDVNIGAGTITCNYDGANKHRTVIGDGVFVGSGVELVAPVEIGAGATIGAGSTISEEAPPGKLTVARSRQKTIDRWKPPVKKR